MYIINPGQRKQGIGKVVAPGQERQGIHYNYKTSFQSWKVLTGKFKFYSKERRRRNRGNQFFQSELEIRDEIRQNTSFRAGVNDPGNQFFKLYGRNSSSTYRELHVTATSVRPKKPVFQVGSVRKATESR